VEGGMWLAAGGQWQMAGGSGGQPKWSAAHNGMPCYK